MQSHRLCVCVCVSNEFDCEPSFLSLSFSSNCNSRPLNMPNWRTHRQQQQKHMSGAVFRFRSFDNLRSQQQQQQQLSHINLSIDSLWWIRFATHLTLPKSGQNQYCPTNIFVLEPKFHFRRPRYIHCRQIAICGSRVLFNPIMFCVCHTLDSLNLTRLWARAFRQFPRSSFGRMESFH